MVKSIKSKVDLHDRTQIQTTFDYFLARDSDGKIMTKGSQRFDLEAYFFFPPQFDIHPHTYFKKDFYKDLRPLLRLKAPRYNYKDFCGDKLRFSVLDELLKKINDSDKSKEKEWIREIRLIGCSLRSYLLKRIRRLSKQVRSLDLESVGLDQSFEKILFSLKRYFFLFKKWIFFVEKIHLLKNKNETLKKEINLLDEYIIYSLQDYLSQFLQMIQKKQSGNDRNCSHIILRLRVFGKLLRKYGKKKSITFINLNSSIEDKENFAMRLSYLKRRISQVLYLNVKEKKSFFSKTQLAYVFAAALAAAWALFANMLIWYKLGFGGYQNLTESALGITGTLIIIAFIISYILKDRLKEYGRQRLQKGVLRVLPDHSENIWYEDHLNNRYSLGKIIENQEFIDSSLNLPQEILNQRLLQLGKKLTEQEEVIHYHKIIFIDGKKIKKIASQIFSVKDIIRLNVKRYIERLDDPVQSFCSFDGKSNPLKLNLPKIYYFDIIFHYSQKLRSGKMVQASIDSKRVLLNKDGIIKII